MPCQISQLPAGLVASVVHDTKEDKGHESDSGGEDDHSDRQGYALRRIGTEFPDDKLLREKAQRA